jgi:hypothetical protein
MSTGQSMVELPHARIPGGPETLVILEGLTLENKAPTGRALRLLRWAHKRYTRDYTVYQVARRPGLPAGHTTRDMADDYASWIGPGSTGRSTSSASRPSERSPSTSGPTTASWFAGWS